MFVSDDDLAMAMCNTDVRLIYRRRLAARKVLDVLIIYQLYSLSDQATILPPVVYELSASCVHAQIGGCGYYIWEYWESTYVHQRVDLGPATARVLCMVGLPDLGAYEGCLDQKKDHVGFKDL